GETISQTDALGGQSLYTYNTLGKLLTSALPTVNVTDETGAVHAVSPATTHYYDVSGRLVATRDANGALTTRQLLAGSGYGDDPALAISERHADGGVVQTGYDVFRDARTSINEIGAVETRTYDGMGRLVSLAHASTSTPLTFNGATGAETFDIRGPSIINGNGGADTFLVRTGVGSVVINAWTGLTTPVGILEFEPGVTLSSVLLTSDSSGNLIIVNAAGDRIQVTGQFGRVYGVGLIKFGDGTTLDRQQIAQLAFTGSAGNRAFYGTSGADTFDSRGEAYYIRGEGGADVFVYNAGYGDLEIQQVYGTDSVLQLGAGLDLSNLAFSSDYLSNLVITGPNGERIQVDNQFGGSSWGIGLVQFADGTTLNRQQLINLATTGTANTPRLYGTSGADTFDSHGLAYYAQGGGGQDTFIYNTGYGALEISQIFGSNSIVQFGAGITIAGLSFAGDSSGNLIITGANGDRVKISNQFYGSNYGVGLLQFADGTTLDRQQMIDIATSGTAANRNLYGTSGADTFDTHGQAHYIRGNGGADTFLYNAGYGALTITQYSGTASVLRFGAGITLSSLRFTKTSSDLIITGQAGDRIVVDYQYASTSYGIGSIEFADGTVLSREQITAAITPATPSGGTLSGTAASETLDSAGVYSRITGGGGTDTYIYNAGYGALEINQSNGSNSVLQLGAGITLAGLVFTADSNGGLTIAGAAGDRIQLINQFTSGTYYGVGTILFADGSTLNRQQMLDRVVSGSAANSNIYGSSGNEIIDTHGLAGFANGRGGTDTFIYNVGYGAVEINQSGGTNSVLLMGAGFSASNLTFSADSNGMLTITAAGGDEIRLINQFTSADYYGVGTLQFADGSTLNRQQLLDRVITGSAANRNLHGSSAAQTFDTHGLAHYVNGRGGADTFVYEAGYGPLEIQQSSGPGSVLRMGPGFSLANLIFSAADTALVITGPNGDRVQITNQFLSGTYYGVDLVEFDDGSTLNRQQMIDLVASGSWANRRIYGTAAAETLDTHGLAHFVAGRGGADTYVFNAGYGAVEIRADQGSGASTAILQLGPGITAADLYFTGSGSNLIIAFGIGDRILLTNQLMGTQYGVSEIRFADGSILNRQQFIGLSGSAQSLVDSYTYDGLGQRIRHANSQLGTTALAERTDYDLNGRVVSQIDFNGYATTYAYAYDATLATTGLGVFGGWIQTTTNAAGLTSSASTDYFGRSAGATDFGGHVTNLTYDLAGRLVQKTNNVGQDLRYTYFNTGALASEINLNFGVGGSQSSQSYSYDLAGRRTHETTLVTYTGYDEEGLAYQWTRSLQDASVTYDALGRLTRFVDSGEDAANPVDINYEYDANNNVRLIASTYRDLVSGALTSKEQWFRYDSMNRFVTTGGVLLDALGQAAQTRGAAGNTIGRGANGVDLTYDAAGRRKSAVSTGNNETYAYTASGYLSTVFINGALRVRNVRDSMGRLTMHTEYGADGKIAYSEESTYDAGSQVILSQTSTLQSDGAIITANTTYDYKADVGGGVYTGAYLGGMVVHTRTTSSQIKSGQTTAQPTSETVNTYVWWDGPQQNTITIRPDITKSTVNVSTFTYDTSGNVVSVAIQDGRPRTVNYVTNAAGQVISRKEASAASANPIEYYYRFNNIQRANIGNDGPNGKTNYAASIAQRSSAAQSTAFQGGAATSYADMDQQYDALNANSLAEAEGAPTYTVVQGDTLQSIAASVWGDASLWYLIANFNGLTGADTLVQGARLQLPAQVTNVHHSSDTFQAYDPTRALGSVAPDQVAPTRKGKGCGVIGSILAAVVAIVVTIVTYPILQAGSAALGMKAGAATAAALAGSAAIGSAAGQLTAMATGVQDKFSWKAVGKAALTAMVAGDPKGTILEQMLKAAASNVVSQGVAVATGLQDKFSWTDVAVSAVMAGADGVVGQALGKANWVPAPKLLKPALTGTAAAIAGAGARSLIDGSDFGDNINALLPSVVGSTIGRALTDRIGGGGSASGQAASDDSPAAPQAGGGGETWGFPGLYHDGDGNFFEAPMGVRYLVAPGEPVGGVSSTRPSLWDRAWSAVGGFLKDPLGSISRAVDYAAKSVRTSPDYRPPAASASTGVDDPTLVDEVIVIGKRLYQQFSDGYSGSVAFANNVFDLASAKVKSDVQSKVFLATALPSYALYSAGNGFERAGLPGFGAALKKQAVMTPNLALGAAGSAVDLVTGTVKTAAVVGVNASPIGLANGMLQDATGLSLPGPNIRTLTDPIAQRAGDYLSGRRDLVADVKSAVGAEIGQMRTIGADLASNDLNRVAAGSYAAGDKIVDYGVNVVPMAGAAVKGVQGMRALTLGGRVATAEALAAESAAAGARSGWTPLGASARTYIRDIEVQTGRAIGPGQRSELADALRANDYSAKLTDDALAVSRAEFSKSRSGLISQWEKNTGQTWPTYQENVISSRGGLLRKAGDRYDAHHIIELSNGGPNSWWNLHPAAFPKQHQGGIHRAGGPARSLFGGQ
ncbi:calcium-binding protein, partial [Caulobacter radicis]